jgi:hypothetical protein
VILLEQLDYRMNRDGNLGETRSAPLFEEQVSQ